MGRMANQDLPRPPPVSQLAPSPLPQAVAGGDRWYHERRVCVATISGLGIEGFPAAVQLYVGTRYAAVIADPGRARRLADLMAGLVDLPVGAVVERFGPARLVPAEGGLLPHLTVLRNLLRAYRAAHRRVPRTRAIEACHALATPCGVGDVLQRYPYEIAPGRRRLAGVARALCGEAKVIVLEDADGLPTWEALLHSVNNPGLLGAALLLITPDRGRTAGFVELGDG